VTTDSRFRLITVESHSAPKTLAEDVRDGLGAVPKTLPPKYFYDELGSVLFDAICLLPEYYPTRAEREILTRSAREIVARVPAPVELVELGSGSAEKTRFVIEAILERQPALHYVPVDISAAALELSSRALLGTYEGLRITGYASEYAGALSALRESPAEGTRLALFLGGNIGNFKKGKARAFLRDLRKILSTGDALLLGADLRKDAAVLEAAYDDALGVTAAFNLNLLSRINRELGAEFDLRRFAHRAHYNERRGRIEMHLVSRGAQAVEVRALGMTVRFRDGETIHTENSHKYDLDGLSRMAADTGFERAETWTDSGGRFSSNLFVAI
jgi:L-histidine Nalpha-methyltransferase